MKFVDRVRGMIWVGPSRLLPDPHNYRLHGGDQRGALGGILASIGVADSLLVWVPNDAARAALQALPRMDPAAFLMWAQGYEGDYQLIDGHLRADVARDQPLACVVVDLNAAEAAELLAVHDPIATLAGFDAAMYRELMSRFESTSPVVGDFVAMVAATEARMREDASAMGGAVLGPDVGDGVDDAHEEASDSGADRASGKDSANGDAGQPPRASLADRFGVPPFSVLDARQGYWQERKRAWLALGIKSELGRGENGHNAAPGGGAREPG